jgi:hypothetical protein
MKSYRILQKALLATGRPGPALAAAELSIARALSDSLGAGAVNDACEGWAPDGSMALTGADVRHEALSPSAACRGEELCCGTMGSHVGAILLGMHADHSRAGVLVVGALLGLLTSS